MSDWDEMAFSEAFEINPKIKLTKGEEYPFVDMQALDPGARSVHSNQIRKFTGGGSKFQRGDTLLARITPCLENGKIARYSNESIRDAHGSTEFIVIRGRKGVTTTDFAHYVVRSPLVHQYAISQMTGTSGRQRVPTDAFDHLFIPIPDLDEQQTIAYILGTLDDKIELNRRMNETLEGIARALFKSWFIDFDPVRAKAEGRQPFGMDEETAALFPDQFEDSELGEIPKGWRIATLGEVIDCYRGLSYKGSHLGEPGIPLHNLNSVFEGGGYKHSGIKYYSGDYQERHVIRPGELVVTNTEQGFDYLLIGFPAIIPDKFGEVGLFSHHLYKIVSKPEMALSIHFLYYLLMTPTVREQVISCTNGTTVNMLSPDGLAFPKFVNPPSRLVTRFEGVICNLFDKMELNVRNMELLHQTRNRLLPKLISGEIRIKQSEIIN